MRKIAVLIPFVMLASALPALAQDASSNPAPGSQTSGSSAQIAPYVGLDIFDRATTAYQAQDYQTAVEELSLFILLNPTDGQSYYLRAASHYYLNDDTSAMVDINRALTLPAANSQETGAMYLLRAEIYLDQKNNDAAMSDLNASIQDDATSPQSFFQRGRLFAVEGDFAKALDDLNQLVKLAPTSPQAYALRALVNAQLQNFDAAEADYTQLIALSPNDPTGYAARAELYLQQKNYLLAVGDLNSALKLDPTTGQLYLLRGLANNALGNPTSAASDYFEWTRTLQPQINTDYTLRPGESQVVPLQTGHVYIMNFQAKAGQTVTITANAEAGAKTDPLLVLLDNQAKPLIADDDGGGEANSAIKDYSLPSDGYYGLIVAYSGGGADGPVQVLLQVKP